MHFKVKRFDQSYMESVSRTSQGFLRAPAVATRTGVFVYQKMDGSEFRELRLPEEVFHPDSMESLAGAPFTILHPTEAVTSSNSRTYMKGFASEKVFQQDDKLKTVITITDSDAITKVEAGMHQLSCGYECELEMAPGTYLGERYDAIQRLIRYNHIAAVPKGRAGPDVKLRLDADDAFQIEGDVMTKKLQTDTDVAPTEKKEAPAKEAPKTEEKKETPPAVEEPKPSEKQVDEPVKKSESEVAVLQAKVDTLQAKLDSMEEEKKTRMDSVSIEQSKIRELVKARARLEKIAANVITDLNMDSMEDEALKIAVIQAESPKAILEGKSSAYIEARFDHAAESIESRFGGLKSFGDKLLSRRDTSEGSSVEDAKKRQIERTMGAWKEPVGVSKKV